MLRTFSGASVRRVIDRGGTEIPEHAHDWPMVSVFVIGSYRNETEVGTQLIGDPSVVFYRAGAAHRNSIAEQGFEQIEIEFDPAWIGQDSLPSAPVRRWFGTEIAALSRFLVRASNGEGAEKDFRIALGNLLRSNAPQVCFQMSWVESVRQLLRQNSALPASELARRVNRHPAWIGAAYRQASGEGLREAAARFRVERAACLLRETDESCATVALEAGFFDQSHMNRTIKRILGRSPSEVRADRRHFRRV